MFRGRYQTHIEFNELAIAGITGTSTKTFATMSEVEHSA
jgi:hypothetical protein